MSGEGERQRVLGELNHNTELSQWGRSADISRGGMQ